MRTKYGDDYVRFVVLSRLSKGKRSLLWSHSCSWRAVGDEEGVHPMLDNVVREFVFSRLKKNLAGCFDSSCNPVEVRGFWGASVFYCRSQDLTGNEGEGEAQGRRGSEVEAYQLIVGGGRIFTWVDDSLQRLYQMVCEMAIEDVLTCVDFIAKAAGVGLLLPNPVQPFIRGEKIVTP